MMQQVLDLQVARALARSALYRFLSLAFQPPDGELKTLAAEAQAAAEGSDEVGTHLDAAHRSLRETDGAALGDAYHHLFGHLHSQDCPLYETQYGAGHVFQQAQQLADIAGFYLAFGLDVGDEVRERPDHLSVELEFMHVLAYREAYARIHHGTDEVALLGDAQRAFLRDHLSRWVPVLARLITRRDDGFYRRAVDLSVALVAADAAAFGVPPAEEMAFVPIAAGAENATLPCGAETCPLNPS